MGYVSEISDEKYTEPAVGRPDGVPRKSGSHGQRYRWLASRSEILEAEEIRRNAGAIAFARLLLGGDKPLEASLTVLFEGTVMQFGRPDPASAERLSRLHADGDLHMTATQAETATLTAEECGFDLSDEHLGLDVETNLRHPMPVERDSGPGEWRNPVVIVRDPSFFTRVLVQRNLGLGEAFLKGEFEMLRGSVHHLVAFFLLNDIDHGIRLTAAEKAKLFLQYLKWRSSHSLNEDIADHYDIGDNIMVPMLGATGCYSCGYMEREADDLDTMQVHKMNLIFSKMRLKPGMRILDTGCGNGGMLVHAAMSWGCEGEGFTNSYNMASLARRNAEANGVGDRLKIHHADFSLLKSYPDGHFDAIYEVGVWEHLPFRQYAEVMRECHRILKPHGRMLIHSMGSHQSKHLRDGYIQKYIFRDSNQIRLHLLLDQARRRDMYVADVENIGRHYYWTLWRWKQNLIEAYEKDQSISQNNFRVMLYFLECGMAESRFGDATVYQLLLFKDARDYRATWRIDGRMHEAGHGAITGKPFLMKPCNLNEHLHNDAFTEGKLQAAIYRKPGPVERLRHWLDIIRNVTHQ